MSRTNYSVNNSVPAQPKNAFNSGRGFYNSKQYSSDDGSEPDSDKYE
jgi:hypothetical protein